MKISYIQNNNSKSTETRISYNLIKEFEKQNIEILLNECDNTCDFILSINGLSQNKTFKPFKSKYPHIKTIMYVWDLYPWTPYARGYSDIKEYTEIWVPSHEVILRLHEIYNVNPDKCKVVKCYAEFFEDINNSKSNTNHIYHAVRSYQDPNKGFTERACELLDLPLIKSEHNLSFEEYKETILKSAFLVLEYKEASTGGLTMLEGYYHGKNLLFSDSIYQGGRDYFGDRAYYFKDGDFDDFTEKIQMLWNIKDEYVNLEDRKKFCEQYTIEAMTGRIIENLKRLKSE
jgi:hypothetical protein